MTSQAAPGSAAAERPLTIALPKGRVAASVAKLLEKAGVTADDGAPIATSLLAESRALVRRGLFGGVPLRFLLLKPDDVPTYVEYGTADLGVSGRDVLAEHEADLHHLVDLGIGRCRLAVAGPKVAGPAGGKARGVAGRMPRVATKYPRSAADHFARKGMQVEVVDVHGSVELAAVTGLSDLVVDLVETGTTLVENGLEVKEEILQVTSLLVVNRASYKLRLEPIRALADAIRAVV